jgi:hypothetical protein
MHKKILLSAELTSKWLPSSHIFVGLRKGLRTQILHATSISIVAVHGMDLENNDDHADNPWIDKKSRKNWLRDLLPLQIQMQEFWRISTMPMLRLGHHLVA